MCKLRIIQMTPTFTYGDGVGNDVMAIHNYLLSKPNVDTKVYSEVIDERIPEDVAENISMLPLLNENDIIIFHISTGSKLNELITEIPGKKIFKYHNITSPKWFDGYSMQGKALSEKGLEQVRRLRNVPDLCLADSEFNKQELIKMGYKCPIAVVPILIPLEDYKQKADEEIIKQYRDGYTNILFTGRIVPNKKQEDVIRSFALYKKYYNPKSRLILIGAYSGIERYYEQLQLYTDTIRVDDVIFTGKISFTQILAYYELADVFLCMSEHEGFCIPLIEAMVFQTPIIAYDSCAISETMGCGGILLKEKNFLEIAGLVNYVMKNPDIRENIIKKQREKLEMMSYDRVVSILWDEIKKLLQR